MHDTYYIRSESQQKTDYSAVTVVFKSCFELGEKKNSEITAIRERKTYKNIYLLYKFTNSLEKIQIGIHQFIISSKSSTQLNQLHSHTWKILKTY